MRAAVLLYGALNIFETIYLDPELRNRTIPGCLDANSIPYDVFVATENKGFFKNFLPDVFDGKSIHGLEFIGVSHKYYHHVAEYPTLRVRDVISKAFGDRVRDIVVDEVAFDKKTWGGPYMYSHMIRTFFKRKFLAYSMMCDYIAKSGTIYDVVFIVRPDSSIRVKGKSKRNRANLQLTFKKDLDAFVEDRNVFWADQGAFNFCDNDLAIIKNDFACGSVQTMGQFLSIANLIDTIGDGNFRKIYPRRAFRDDGSMTLSALDDDAISSQTRNNGVEVTL